jgi:hypothetical protein
MLSPEDLLHFVELNQFRDEWEKLGLDVENDLWALQIAIMSKPDGPPVVPGTGGLRKIRFAPLEWHTGKRGAVRVCYVYLKEHWTVLLVMAYGKNEKLDLTPEEKKGIKEYIKLTKAYLDKKKYTSYERFPRHGRSAQWQSLRAK